MAARRTPPVPRRLLAVLPGFAALLGFVTLAALLVVEGRVPLDERVQDLVHDQASAARTRALVVVTRVGGGPGLGVLVAVAAVVLARRDRRREALLLVAATVGSELLNLALKQLFRRARPELWPSPAPALGFAFPSGHAMTSATVALVAVALAWRTRARWAVVAGAVAAVLLVGLSRVYLGVHYPSDVLAGWCAAGAWTALVLAVGRRAAGADRPRRGVR